MRKGFTIIELLVVIGLITLLAAVATLGFSRSRAVGRDARRLNDLLEISHAVEQYGAAKNDTYPAQTANGDAASALGALSSFAGREFPRDPRPIAGAGQSADAGYRYVTQVSAYPAVLIENGRRTARYALATAFEYPKAADDTFLLETGLLASGRRGYVVAGPRCQAGECN